MAKPSSSHDSGSRSTKRIQQVIAKMERTFMDAVQFPCSYMTFYQRMTVLKLLGRVRVAKVGSYSDSLVCTHNSTLVDVSRTVEMSLQDRNLVSPHYIIGDYL